MVSGHRQDAVERLPDVEAGSEAADQQQGLPRALDVVAQRQPVDEQVVRGHSRT
jgi:hypothetical protein